MDAGQDFVENLQALDRGVAAEGLAPVTPPRKILREHDRMPVKCCR